MAAFGITFPKLSLCRSTTSKVDPNGNSNSTTTTTGTCTRTLSLSIKNVPSQSLHYDISTSTSKKKTTPMATILAIDGETKQLPKNLSVFNELQLDDGKINKHSFDSMRKHIKRTFFNVLTDDEDIHERRKQSETTSNTILIPSSASSPMRTIPQYPDIQLFPSTDSKDEGKYWTEIRRSNHTFTPPTSSLSPHSSSNELHLTSSSLSVDLPQLKYAIEKFLLDDDDDPIYQFVDEFPPGSSFHYHGKNPPVDHILFHSISFRTT